MILGGLYFSFKLDKIIEGNFSSKRKNLKYEGEFEQNEIHI
jgi:hypothetical protein